MLTVCGRVGFVEDGQDVRKRRDPDDVRRVAAARALGVVGVDRPAGDRLERRLEEAGLVERVGVDRDLHAGLVGDAQAGVDRRRRRAPVLVQLEPAGAGRAPARSSASAETVLPLPSSSTLTGQLVDRARASAASASAPGVTVVAFVPSAGPVPPPMSVVIPEASASSTICGQMKWTWQSTAAGGEDPALAREDLGARADPQARGGRRP